MNVHFSYILFDLQLQYRHARHTILFQRKQHSAKYRKGVKLVGKKIKVRKKENISTLHQWHL